MQRCCQLVVQNGFQCGGESSLHRRCHSFWYHLINVGGDSIRREFELLLQLGNLTKRRLKLGLPGGILLVHTRKQMVHVPEMLFE